MPAASSAYLDKIYQFVGATTENYINGYFYKCISNGETPAVYSWINIPVMPIPVTSAEEVASMWNS